MQTAIAAIDAPASPQAPIKEKKQRISKRVAQAIELIVTGQCRFQKDAAERVNITPEHLCRELAKGHVRVFCERRARETVANGLMRASAKMVELIDANSEHVAADMSRHIAAIHGIKPANSPQVSVNIELKAGYVIDLTGRAGTYPSDMSSKDSDQKTVDHEPSSR